MIPLDRQRTGGSPRTCPHCGLGLRLLTLEEAARHVGTCHRRPTEPTAQAAIDADVRAEREGRAWARRHQPSSTYDEVVDDLDRQDGAR